MNGFNIFSGSLSTSLRSLLIFLIIMFFLIRVKEFLYLINKKRNYEDYINSLKYGALGKKDLLQYSPLEFEHWCAEFLEKRGYTDIQVTPSKHDSGKDIICRKGIETYYVECKRYDYSKNAQFKVDIEIARKLIGAMETYNIRKGLIITTGYAANEAVEYLKTLPKDYNVEIIDGDELIRQYLSVRHLIYSAQKS